MRRTNIALAAILWSGTAAHASDLGTEAQAREIAAALSDIVKEGGIDAGIAAMHDASMPFATSELGIHLFEDSIIVGDNREPELIASSYAEVEDLTGEPMWPRIVAAANTKSDAVLEWYHYNTEAEYTYACYSEWAIENQALVMVCR